MRLCQKQGTTITAKKSAERHSRHTRLWGKCRDAIRGAGNPEATAVGLIAIRPKPQGKCVRYQWGHQLVAICSVTRPE